MTDPYRTGGHWPVTVIEVGTEPVTGEGRREGDRLMATAQTPEDAQRIVAALNAARAISRS